MAELNYSYDSKDKEAMEKKFEAVIKKATNHVVSRLITWYLAFIVFSFISTSVFNWFQVGWDSTDGVSTRSNMEVRIDYGTGCEYLVDERGGLTPRLSPEGEHMCGSVENY